MLLSLMIASGTSCLKRFAVIVTLHRSNCDHWKCQGILKEEDLGHDGRLESMVSENYRSVSQDGRSSVPSFYTSLIFSRCRALANHKASPEYADRIVLTVHFTRTATPQYDSRTSTMLLVKHGKKISYTMLKKYYRGKSSVARALITLRLPIGHLFGHVYIIGMRH